MKTPKEIIRQTIMNDGCVPKHVKDMKLSDPVGQFQRNIIDDLDAAGYVIVPKEPPDADIKAVAAAIARSRSPDSKATHCMIDATVACVEYAKIAAKP